MENEELFKKILHSASCILHFLLSLQRQIKTKQQVS